MDESGLRKINCLSNYSWIFVKLKRPPCGSYFWNIASNITIVMVGVFTRFVTNYLNKTVCYNQDAFLSTIHQRNEKVPLITVSNHLSCFDDPGLWGCLNISRFNSKQMRWSLAAHNICFTNRFSSYFFMLGKCIPVIRGGGVYQNTGEEYVMDEVFGMAEV